MSETVKLRLDFFKSFYHEEGRKTTICKTNIMEERLSFAVKGTHCRQNSFVIHVFGQFKLR